MRPQVGRTTRVKKLQPRAPQQVLRQDQIESNEYDSLQGQYKVETGVEKSEESEIHLQAALAGSGEKEAEEIPAPPAQESSNFDYDALYFKPAKKYCTYIRYSQTVEESNGCQYDMTTEDDTYLTEYNQKKPSTAQLSEDDFERIMEIFENTAEVQSPFASVDQTTIPWETMKLALKQKMEPRYLLVAQEIYEYWKGRRQASGNRPLQPSLKFETHQDNDDGDPYVCFRRREIRQTRKTRARDVQSTDKLKKLRKEIEDGRELVRMALFREVTKKELLAMDKLVFEQRQKVKEAKIRLGIKGDDDDLINQLPRKRKATDFTRPNQQPGSAQLRLPGRADGRPVDADLVSLSELQAKKEADLRDDLAQKALYYRKRNERFVDVTREPLSPVHLPGKELAFRPATAQYQLMTPPSSVTSESSGENINSSKMEIDTAAFRFSSPPAEDEQQTQPAYRRRMGRLNRLWIDRRGIPTAPKEMDENVSDRWKYDQDDDDEQPVFTMDEYSTEALAYRSKLASTIFEMRRAQAEAPRHASNSSPATIRTVAATSQPAPT